MSEDIPAPVKEFLSKLPEATQGLVSELRKLQGQRNELESKLEEEIEALHEKYDKLYQPLYDQRSKLLTSGPAEVPSFWLTVLKKAPVVRDMITEKDEPVLQHLQDIKLTENKKTGFTLSFHFKTNPFFRNTILTKTFTETEASSASPLADEGKLSSKGSAIDWHPGKDTTTKTINKKQRHRGTGQPRTVTKQVSDQSFFHFFADVDEDVIDRLSEKDPENIPQVMLADVEVGSVIRERVIPFAVAIFTGEMTVLGHEEDGDEDDEDDDEEEDDEEGGAEEEDDDDEEDEEEEEEEEKKAAPKKGSKKGGAGNEKKPECKQQ